MAAFRGGLPPTTGTAAAELPVGQPVGDHRRGASERGCRARAALHLLEDLKGGEVQRWARFCSFRGDYTGFEIDGEYYAGPSRCHLHVADFDFQGRHWHGQKRPGLDRHITLEELAAQVWGVEGRLHFPSETEARCLHGGDNTAAVSAAAKGRSSCRAMHALCRKVNAIFLAGGLGCFWFYIPFAKNPSDRASRIALQQQHRSMISPAVSTLPTLVFVHAFSGKRRVGDLEFWLRGYAAECGIQIVVVSIDMNVARHLDMLSNKLFSQLRCWCWSGRVFGWHGGPPCNTWTKARWARVALLPCAVVACHSGLASLSPRLKLQCSRGSELSPRNMDCMEGVLASGGCATPEHPADPGRAPFPSWWQCKPYVSGVS